MEGAPHGRTRAVCQLVIGVRGRHADTAEREELEEAQAGDQARHSARGDHGRRQHECDQGGRGQIIDEQILAEQEAIKEAVKNGFAMLAECFVRKDGPSVLTILMDSSHPNRVRKKAAEMIGDIGEVEAIEPLRNAKFGNELVQKEVDNAITKIHVRNFTRECPFCAEIIKKRAKVCKHCSQEVAGH